MEDLSLKDWIILAWPTTTGLFYYFHKAGQKKFEMINVKLEKLETNKVSMEVFNDTIETLRNEVIRSREENMSGNDEMRKEIRASRTELSAQLGAQINALTSALLSKVIA